MGGWALWAGSVAERDEAGGSKFRALVALGPVVLKPHHARCCTSALAVPVSVLACRERNA